MEDRRREKGEESKEGQGTAGKQVKEERQRWRTESWQDEEAEGNGRDGVSGRREKGKEGHGRGG